MKTHTDSQIVTFNEDGSRTIEIVETIYPATKGQQAAAWRGVLIGISVLPLVPLAGLVLVDKIQERRDRKARQKRNEKK